MARRTRHRPHDAIVDVVADGLTDDEIAARFEAWLHDLDSVPPVELRISAADELRNAHADNDV